MAEVTASPIDVMTPMDVAAVLQMSVREVQEQFASGEIPGAWKVGRLWRIRRIDFESWLAAKALAATERA